MKNKFLLGFGTIAATVAPVASVIACSKSGESFTALSAADQKAVLDLIAGLTTGDVTSVSVMKDMKYKGNASTDTEQTYQAIKFVAKDNASAKKVLNFLLGTTGTEFTGTEVIVMYNATASKYQITTAAGVITSGINPSKEALFKSIATAAKLITAPAAGTFVAGNATATVITNGVEVTFTGATTTLGGLGDYLDAQSHLKPAILDAVSAAIFAAKSATGLSTQATIVKITAGNASKQTTITSTNLVALTSANDIKTKLTSLVFA